MNPDDRLVERVRDAWLDADDAADCMPGLRCDLPSSTCICAAGARAAIAAYEREMKARNRKAAAIREAPPPQETQT